MKFTDALAWLRENPGREAWFQNYGERVRLRFVGGAYRRDFISDWIDIGSLPGYFLDADWQKVPREEKPAPETAWTATPRELGAKDKPSGDEKKRADPKTCLHARRPWREEWPSNPGDGEMVRYLCPDCGILVALFPPGTDPYALERIGRANPLADRLAAAEKVVDDLLGEPTVIEVAEAAFAYRQRWPKGKA